MRGYKYFRKHLCSICLYYETAYLIIDYRKFNEDGITTDYYSRSFPIISGGKIQWGMESRIKEPEVRKYAEDYVRRELLKAFS